MLPNLRPLPPQQPKTLNPVPCVCAGTAGDTANRAVAQELLATPDWGLLALPLIRAVHNIVQSASVVKGGSPHHAVHAARVCHLMFSLQADCTC